MVIARTPRPKTTDQRLMEIVEGRDRPLCRSRHLTSNHGKGQRLARLSCLGRGLLPLTPRLHRLNYHREH